MEKSISLADGTVTNPEKLRRYFVDIVFAAEDSGAEFPVNLEDVSRIGHARKDTAVAALRRSFIEGVDYQVSRKVPENPQGGRPEEVFHLTVSCLEYFVVRGNRDVFEVYRQCRKAVRHGLQSQQPQIPQDLPTALRLAADLAEHKAVLEQQLVEAKPKIEFFDKVAAAKNAVSMATAAKVLKLPGVGRNNLFKLLKQDNILQANNEPLQRYVDAGYFELEPQPYLAGKNGKKGQRLGCTTRVTGPGLEWLSGRYNAA